MTEKRTPIPCPNIADHTPRPEGYIQWVPWAERMSKTHRQIMCSGCGLYAIWVPKDDPRRDPDKPTTYFYAKGASAK